MKDKLTLETVVAVERERERERESYTLQNREKYLTLIELNKLII